MPNSQQIFVIVKGSVGKAVFAANERAIVLHYPEFHKVSPHHSGEVRAFVDAECLPEVQQWFHETAVDAKSYDEGTLLWFSEPREFGHRAAEGQ